jgi:nucleoside-diphosphate-sugar epimerase
MNILLLGGYAFLGRALIDAAHARGHAVSAFNRGRLPPMPGVEQLTGDRDSLALDLPAGRTWDAVIDTSGYVPRHTLGAARLLHDRIERYVFVSSLSVYDLPMPPDSTEDAVVQTMPDGADFDDRSNVETYGPRKLACEQAVADVMPGRALVVRPGFIVGPHDYSDRFNAWIERAAVAAEMIVPGDPQHPMQLIDVRDLATWMIAMTERRATGVYNATGPERPMALLDVAPPPWKLQRSSALAHRNSRGASSATERFIAGFACGA